ncbi:MAG TPA: DUF488 domain-containing protein [Anaeromyxobacteraceae bacterium]|nr:DUF488 domain-containing protein [Anaeromyxobacteraceae bacterium]
MATVFTVGYEGRTPADLVRRLREAGVTRVVDVRASARSPRPGFSRAPLGRALEAAGIAYRHLPEVGNPFHAEAAADLAGVLARYREHLAAHPEAEAALATAVADAPTALLCAEANPRRCHRSVLAERLAASGATVVHL